MSTCFPGDVISSTGIIFEPKISKENLSCEFYPQALGLNKNLKQVFDEETLTAIKVKV